MAGATRLELAASAGQAEAIHLDENAQPADVLAGTVQITFRAPPPVSDGPAVGICLYPCEYAQNETVDNPSARRWPSPHVLWVHAPYVTGFDHHRQLRAWDNISESYHWLRFESTADLSRPP